MVAMELMSITCPRCNKEAQVRFYGPCDECRQGVITTMKAEGADMEEVAYEPKMNVVPNQIATKE